MPDPVNYTAMLPIVEPAAAYLSGLFDAGRCRRRTRQGRRALGSWRHAVLVLRWFLDAPVSANRPQTTRSAAPRPTDTCMRHRSPRCGRARPARRVARGAFRGPLPRRHRPPWRVGAITAAASSCSTTSTTGQPDQPASGKGSLSGLLLSPRRPPRRRWPPYRASRRRWPSCARADVRRTRPTG